MRRAVDRVDFQEVERRHLKCKSLVGWSQVPWSLDEGIERILDLLEDKFFEVCWDVIIFEEELLLLIYHAISKIYSWSMQKKSMDRLLTI